MRRPTSCFALVLSLALAGSGCGSDDSPPGGPPGNPDGGSLGFGGSCTVAVTSAGITVTVCTDYNNMAASSVQSGCLGSGGSGITTSYASGHCTTTNLLGKCTMASSSTVNYYYPTTGLADSVSITADQKACANAGGTWSNP